MGRSFSEVEIYSTALLLRPFLETIPTNILGGRRKKKLIVKAVFFCVLNVPFHACVSYIFSIFTTTITDNQSKQRVGIVGFRLNAFSIRYKLLTGKYITYWYKKKYPVNFRRKRTAKCRMCFFENTLFDYSMTIMPILIFPIIS